MREDNNKFYFLEPATYQNVRDARIDDPRPLSNPDLSPEGLSNATAVSLKSAADSGNTLQKAAETVTKLKKDNFWLALLLSIDHG